MDQIRPLATPAQVSDYLGVPVNTLKQWRVRQVGPRYCKIGGRVRYRWSDVEAFVAAQTKETAEGHAQEKAAPGGTGRGRRRAASTSAPVYATRPSDTPASGGPCVR